MDGFVIVAITRLAQEWEFAQIEDKGTVWSTDARKASKFDTFRDAALAARDIQHDDHQYDVVAITYAFAREASLSSPEAYAYA